MKWLTFVVIISKLIQILSSPIKVDTERNHLVDEKGRDVFFHGVNIVYKIPPFIPQTDKFDPTHSFSIEDIQFLKEMGMNIIRLGVQWPGVEPNKGEFNQTYIDGIKSIVKNCKENGIFTLLDFHQDILSEKFCGEGIPKWAVKPAYFTLPFPLPLQLSSFTLDSEGVPSKEDCKKHDWVSYHASMKLSSAFQSLYSNVDGIQDDFGVFWRKVAEEFIILDLYKVLPHNLK